MSKVDCTSFVKMRLNQAVSSWNSKKISHQAFEGEASGSRDVRGLKEIFIGLKDEDTESYKDLVNDNELFTTALNLVLDINSAFNKNENILIDKFNSIISPEQKDKESLREDFKQCREKLVNSAYDKIKAYLEKPGNSTLTIQQISTMSKALRYLPKDKIQELNTKIPDLLSKFEIKKGSASIKNNKDGQAVTDLGSAQKDPNTVHRELCVLLNGVTKHPEFSGVKGKFGSFANISYGKKLHREIKGLKDVSISKVQSGVIDSIKGFATQAKRSFKSRNKGGLGK